MSTAKKFYKVKGTGIHGDFTFFAELYSSEDIKEALFFCLGHAGKLIGKTAKAKPAEIDGLKKFDGVNSYYFSY